MVQINTDKMAAAFAAMPLVQKAWTKRGGGDEPTHLCAISACVAYAGVQPALIKRMMDLGELFTYEKFFLPVLASEYGIMNGATTKQIVVLFDNAPSIEVGIERVLKFCTLLNARGLAIPADACGCVGCQLRLVAFARALEAVVAETLGVAPPPVIGNSLADSLAAEQKSWVGKLVDIIEPKSGSAIEMGTPFLGGQAFKSKQKPAAISFIEYFDGAVIEKFSGKGGGKLLAASALEQEQLASGVILFKTSEQWSADPMPMKLPSSLSFKKMKQLIGASP